MEIGEFVGRSGGVRLEREEATFRTLSLGGQPPGTDPLTPEELAPQRSEETLFSYRAGAVLKPRPNISLYAAFANAKTPSSATVRLGCGIRPAPGAADPCATAPETARSYEIGVKAEIGRAHV